MMTQQYWKLECGIGYKGDEGSEQDAQLQTRTSIHCPVKLNVSRHIVVKSVNALLYLELQDGVNQSKPHSQSEDPSPAQVVSNDVVKLKSSSLLMTCRVLVFVPDWSPMESCFTK